MNNIELKESLTNNMFATKNSIQEAVDFGMVFLRASGVDSDFSSMMVMQILMNSIAEQIDAEPRNHVIDDMVEVSSFLRV